MSLRALLLVLIAASPAFAVPRAKGPVGSYGVYAEIGRERVLRKLGVPSKYAGTEDPQARGLERKTEPVPSLGKAVDKLRSRSFLRRPSLFTKKERETMARGQVEHMMSSGFVRLAPKGQQKWLRGIYRSLYGTAVRELGIGERTLSQHLAVIDHPGYGSNAEALANGAIAYTSQRLQDDLVIATVADHARTPTELLEGLWHTWLGGELPGPSDERRATRLARAITAGTLAHELSHALKGHGTQLSTDPESPPSTVQIHTQEKVADVGGVELALRAGYSGLGIGLAALHLVHGEIQAGQPFHQDTDSHPDAFERYRGIYKALQLRASRERVVYDDKGARRTGAPYLSAERLAELALLPTPAQVEAFFTKKIKELGPPSEAGAP